MCPYLGNMVMMDEALRLTYYGCQALAQYGGKGARQAC
jgi:hypothetical protein